MALQDCPECEARISEEAEECPKCGKKIENEDSGCGVFLFIMLVILVLFYFLPRPFIKVIGLADQKLGVPIWINAERNEKSLSFTYDQIEYINSEYDENIEVAWCFDVINGEVSNLRKASQQVGSTENVVFRCTENPDGMMHSHTSFFTFPYMSRTDMGQLDQSSFAVSCVVAGKVRKNDNPIMLNCFRKEEENEFSRYHIEITNEDE